MEQEIFNIINLKEIIPVVLMSLYVSLTSTLIASILGMLLGIPCALLNFKSKRL